MPSELALATRPTSMLRCTLFIVMQYLFLPEMTGLVTSDVETTLTVVIAIAQWSL